MRTDKFNLQKQPSAKPIDSPGLEAAQHLLKRSSLPAAPTPQRRPAVPERQLLATPAVGPLLSESNMPMLRQLRRCLTSAITKTVRGCLLCLTSLSSARDFHCIDTAAVAALRRRPEYLTQHSN